MVAQYRVMNYALRVRRSREFRDRRGKYDSELIHNLSADVEYWIDEVPLLALAEVKNLQ